MLPVANSFGLDVVQRVVVCENGQQDDEQNNYHADRDQRHYRFRHSSYEIIELLMIASSFLLIFNEKSAAHFLMRSRSRLTFSYFNDPTWLLSGAIMPETKDHIRRSFKESNVLFPAYPAPAMLQANELLFHFSPACRANPVALSHVRYPIRMSSCGVFSIFVIYSCCKTVKNGSASSIVWTGLPSTSSTAS